jgi:peroxiredoxin Q/BCP
MKLLSIVALTLCIAAGSIAADAPSVVPAEGTAAPAFSLLNQEGKSVSLNDLHGKWVVLYFYPKDYTSGCTLEAHNFQRDLEKYQADNAVILGVSLDPVDSHKGFCAKEGLNFKLLADTEHVVTSQYGSLMLHDGTNYAARNTFLIDPKGVIRKVYLKVSPAKHSDEVLADLATLQAKK